MIVYAFRVFQMNLLVLGTFLSLSGTLLVKEVTDLFLKISFKRTY